MATYGTGKYGTAAYTGDPVTTVPALIAVQGTGKSTVDAVLTVPVSGPAPGSFLTRAVVSSTKGGGSGNDLSLTIPASTVAGDLLVAGVSQNSRTTTLTGPVGWTLVATRISGNAGTARTQTSLWYRVAQPDDAGVVTTWTSTGIAAMFVTMAAYYEKTGQTWASLPLDEFGVASNAISVLAGTNLPTASITTTGELRLLVASLSAGATGVTFTPPADMIERSDITEGAGSSTLADGEQALAGASGTKTFTASVAADNYASVIAAFRLGSVGKTYTLTFTPGDLRSTATDELVWEVRTAAGTGGTVLASGVGTANVAITTPLIVDSTLVNGNNTRYIHVTDGAGNIYNDPFIVNAQFAFPADMTVDSEGVSTVEATVNTIIRLTVDSAGTSNVSVALKFAKPIVVDSAGMSTVNVVVQQRASFSVDIAGTSTVNARLIPESSLLVDASGWSTTDIKLTASPSLALGIAGTSAVDAGLTARTFLTVDSAGTSTTDIKLVVIPYIAVRIAASSSTEVTLASNNPLVVDIAGTSSMDVSLLQLIPVSGYRLRADIHSPTGVRLGAGPLYQILSAEYGESLDGVGTFSLEIPAIDPMAEYVVSGNEVRLYRDGEGLVFRGLIDSRETLIDAAGKLTLSITGDSIARQLVWANTLLGREFSNVTMSSAVTTLLSGTGWTASSVQTDTRNLTAQYDGASIWQALAHSAEIFGWHVRERNLTRQVDIGKMGTSSGLVMQNVEHVTEDMGVLPITRLQLGETQGELWNRVVPVGGGDGINALNLRYATRTTPYTRQSATGPDGQTYYYIQDSASVAEHGLRVKVLSVKDVVPISNSVAEIRNAANTLYDIAAAWLGWHSQVQESYQADIVGLKHIVDGQTRFRVGNTARLVYRGAVVDEGGRRLWRSVDRNVYIMGYTRRFNADGSDGWSFSVSTTDRDTPSDADAVAKALEDLWAIKTAKRPYTYREIHGPFTESIAANDDARFLVDFDSSVTYLHSATLRVRKRRVKSNVSGAASGGGQTVAAGTPQTAVSGGGQTSGGGGSHGHSVTTAATPSGGGHTSGSGDSHTHNVTGGTATSTGSHGHIIARTSGTFAWTQQPFQQQLVFQVPGSGTFGVFVERGGSGGGQIPVTEEGGSHSHPLTGVAAASEGTHKHSILNHSHTVSGQAASTVTNHEHNIVSHSHSISSHTHELPNHTHALIYGIYLGPTATIPQMRVLINGTDRTTVLGGPWNSDFLVDITAYLTDSQGHVLRAANNINIASSQLLDAEVTVKSLVTSTSVVPV